MIGRGMLPRVIWRSDEKGFHCGFRLDVLFSRRFQPAGS